MKREETLTQIKTDGIGFQVISPNDLPKASLDLSKDLLRLASTQTENSINNNPDHERSVDPLLVFLQQRKQNRQNFESRYSKRAIAHQAYRFQKDQLDPSQPSSQSALGLLLEVRSR